MNRLVDGQVHLAAPDLSILAFSPSLSLGCLFSASVATAVAFRSAAFRAAQVVKEVRNVFGHYGIQAHPARA